MPTAAAVEEKKVELLKNYGIPNQISIENSFFFLL